MARQAAVNIGNDGATWTDGTGLRSVPCQRPSQDICQQEKVVITTTSFPPCPTQTGIYFRVYSALQDSCSLTDYSFEEDVNKGRGVSHYD